MLDRFAGEGARRQAERDTNTARDYRSGVAARGARGTRKKMPSYMRPNSAQRRAPEADRGPTKEEEGGAPESGRKEASVHGGETGS